jgi:hypothetical protein
LFQQCNSLSCNPFMKCTVISENSVFRDFAVSMVSIV